MSLCVLLFFLTLLQLVFEFYWLHLILSCPSIERPSKSLPFSILQARKPEKRDDLIVGGIYHEEVSHVLHQFCQWCPCPKRNPREHKKPHLQLLQFYSRHQPGNTYQLNVHRTFLSWDQVEVFRLISVYFHSWRNGQQPAPLCPALDHLDLRLLKEPQKDSGRSPLVSCLSSVFSLMIQFLTCGFFTREDDGQSPSSASSVRSDQAISAKAPVSCKCY